MANERKKERSDSPRKFLGLETKATFFKKGNIKQKIKTPPKKEKKIELKTCKTLTCQWRLFFSAVGQRCLDICHIRIILKRCTCLDVLANTKFVGDPKNGCIGSEKCDNFYSFIWVAYIYIYIYTPNRTNTK